MIKKQNPQSIEDRIALLEADDVNVLTQLAANSQGANSGGTSFISAIAEEVDKQKKIAEFVEVKYSTEKEMEALKRSSLE